MSMTWAQIRLHYLQATGNTPAAEEEFYAHAAEAQRLVATDPRVDVRELQGIDSSVTISANTDFTELSAVSPTPYAVLQVFNVTDGYNLVPEPEGQMGRFRFLQKTTGKPPVGRITWYVPDGTKLYVRDMPSVDTQLLIRVRREMPTLGLADLNSNPITPAQYDFAIIFLAAKNYYLLHVEENGHAEGQLPPSVKYHQAAEERLTVVVKPVEKEDRNRHETFRLSGYSPNPRSRGGRW